MSALGAARKGRPGGDTPLQSRGGTLKDGAAGAGSFLGEGKNAPRLRRSWVENSE